MTKANKTTMTWPEKILAQVAAGKGTLAELDQLPKANPDSIRWYACRLVQAGKLRRVSPGVYALAKRRAKTSKRRKAAK